MAKRDRQRKERKRRAEAVRLERQAEERRQRRTVAVALLILAALFGISAIFRPDLPSSEATGMSLVAVFVIGLTAGGLSCLAVQGGLLAVAVTGNRETHAEDRESLEGDSTAVISFLGAKLAVYALLGAGLGAAGSLLEPSPTFRAVIQTATALFMIATALHLLGVHPVFRYVVIQPPRFLTRRINRRAKLGGAFAPALLGAMTVFLPCGITQAMQLVAINSGSALAGAAIMSVFVLGTSPLFFTFGYSATKLSDALHARFMKFAALGILAIALFTLDGGLKLLKSPVTLAKAKNVLFKPTKAEPAKKATDGVQEARITVSSGGYSPSNVEIKSGKPARIIFASDGAAGCALSLVFQDRQMVLPQTGETPIELPPQEPGTIEYTCTMGMYGGTIEVV